MVIAKNWGDKEMRSCLMDVEFPFYKTKKMDSGCTAGWKYLKLLKCTLENGKILSCMYFPQLKNKLKKSFLVAFPS